MNNSNSDRQLGTNNQETLQQEENTPTTSVSVSNNIGTGLSQLVHRVDFQNIIQSNTFLRSDLGNLIGDNSTTTPLPVMNRLNSNLNHNHSHASDAETAQNNFDQIVLNMQTNGQNGNPNNSNENGIQHEHQHQHQPGGDQTPNNNFLLFLVQTLQSSLPFFVILIAKIFHQHLLGFFIVLGFVTTLHWSNKTLVRQVELKDKKENIKLVLLVLFLFLNVAVFFFIFKEYKLYNCLIFLSPAVPKMDTWNLIWIVVCSDTIIKFIVISFKAFVTLMPYKIIPLRKRGNYYSVIETIALFYRSLTPIYPWVLFLMYSDPIVHQSFQLQTNAQQIKTADSTDPKHEVNSSTAFPIILCVLYFMCKLNQLYNRFLEVIQSVRDLITDFSYGVPVTLNDFDENICPICQDKLSNPVILRCKHTFCQDCVCVWLDKENSCPMCRAKVSIKKPLFKDGSTSIFIQWF